jgi:hypothetical protein
MSIIFRDNLHPTPYNNTHLDKDLILANHTKQIIVNPMDKIDPEERAVIVDDLLAQNPSQGDLKIDEILIDECKTWTGAVNKTTVTGRQTTKYKLKLMTRVLAK